MSLIVDIFNAEQSLDLNFKLKLKKFEKAIFWENSPNSKTRIAPVVFSNIE